MSGVKFHRVQYARNGQGAVWKIEHNGAEVGLLRDCSGVWLAELNNGERLWGSYGSYLAARRQVVQHFEQKTAR
jgi:hypothetical protein